VTELRAAPPSRGAKYADGLSEREVEVLCQIAAGKTNREIAERLVISPNTAAKHVGNIPGQARAE
jgi:DNA-binding CsgD family transcriptional regulator